MLKFKKAFINGNIFTVAEDQPRAEAVLTVMNKILKLLRIQQLSIE